MELTIAQKLKRPFDANKISWRVGATTKDKASGIALAYIDARDVMQRLDEIVGSEGWQCRYPLAQDHLLICEIGILGEGGWVWKANGAGDTQVEADKGKCSDAFKRAAVLWGIGRYLYALPNQWVELEGRKIPKAKKIHLGETLPHWATPEGYDAIMEKRSAQ
ncbi:Rad52/Rad22 family DNA repair protein [bacterium]|nr:Rad52/Rad22 family DNA repair protein [bacterium]